ncbi:hypothetical protein TNCV_1298141 [Trichonephila clavipes]|nr:hypothetical protein TNCV_1298141 [Trichonephila clavipes]
MLLLMLPDRQCQIEFLEFHQAKELDCTPVISRNFELPAGDSMVYPISPSNFKEEHPGGGFEPRPYGTAVSINKHYIGWAA